MSDPWGVPLSTLFGTLDAAPGGLTRSEAERRLARFGPNAALSGRRRSLPLQVVDRLANPLVLILLFASALSAWTGEVGSFVIIVSIIALSVVLDVFQQYRAENTIDALRRSVALKADVLRDGRLEELAVDLLVPGDVIELRAGDIVPADCRLIEARDLLVSEAMLTGEAYPVEKREGELPAEPVSAGKAANFLFMGTSVLSGTGKALVCRTGKQTELGGLAHGLVRGRPADAFALGIRRFGFLMLRLTVFLVLFVLVTNVLFDRPWLESILFALALAVGLTPELLPMIVTVTLANGATRLAHRRVIVKRLAAIHDLGAMDVLCTDKTGTLTEACIRISGALDASGEESRDVRRLAYLNSLYQGGLRSPLDAAILTQQDIDIAGWRKVDEVPFDFERRRVSILADRGAERLLIVKGAPEDLIRLSIAVMRGDEHAGLDESGRAALRDRFEKLGEDGYRVLAVATKSMPRDVDVAHVKDETDLTFRGFVAFVDPPKRDAAEAIRNLAEIGVDVKILTGDNERVARHVCDALAVPIRGTLSGEDLQHLSDGALRVRARKANLFCRLNPQQKERVVGALRASGKVVGFMGDGINDAAGLHAADVGISVDTGVDVAKEAADLVLLEQDLGVVHDGVLEGRRTVDNVTKYILMGSSSNFGNMFSMAGASLFLPFLPMLPAQVLLNNLLYDISEVGVPFDNVDRSALQKPVRWDTGFIERVMVVLGPISSLFDFLTFFALLRLFGADQAMFQTGWFVESLATQCLVIFVIRTRALPWRSTPHPILVALTLGVVALGLILPATPLAGVFGFVPLPPGFYLFLALATLAYLFLVQMIKPWLFAHHGRRRMPR